MAALEALKKTQRVYVSCFNSVEKTLKSRTGPKISMVLYENLAKRLHQYGDNVEKIHRVIYPLLQDQAAVAAQTEDYDFLCNRYRQLLEELEVRKPDAPTPNPVTQGGISGWNPFYDLFQSPHAFSEEEPKGINSNFQFSDDSNAGARNPPEVRSTDCHQEKGVSPQSKTSLQSEVSPSSVSPDENIQQQSGTDVGSLSAYSAPTPDQEPDSVSPSADGTLPTTEGVPTCADSTSPHSNLVPELSSPPDLSFLPQPSSPLELSSPAELGSPHEQSTCPDRRSPPEPGPPPETVYLSDPGSSPETCFITVSKPSSAAEPSSPPEPCLPPNEEYWSEIWSPPDPFSAVAI